MDGIIQYGCTCGHAVFHLGDFDQGRHAECRPGARD